MQQLSDRSSISVSTLSKIENGQLSPTYEKIAALAIGLGVDVGDLFNQPAKPVPLRRRSVRRAGSGVMHETDQYVYEVLNADLADKRFVPLFTTIKAHSVGEFQSLLRHDGEEFIYVLEGATVIFPMRNSRRLSAKAKPSTCVARRTHIADRHLAADIGARTFSALTDERQVPAASFRQNECGHDDEQI